MLTRFYAKNYKGLLMDPLALGRVNVFIGPNNCGKSNLFSAVSFVFDMFGRPEEGRGSLAAALKRREQGSIVTYGERNVGLAWFWGESVSYEIGLVEIDRGQMSVSGEQMRSLNQHGVPAQVTVQPDGTVTIQTSAGEDPATGSPTTYQAVWPGLASSSGSNDGKTWLQSSAALVDSPSPTLADWGEPHGTSLLVERSNAALHVRCAQLAPADIAASCRATTVRRLDDRALDLTNLLHGWLKTPDYNSRLISELSPLLPGLTDLRVFEGGGYRWIQLQLRGEWRNLSELSDGTVIALLLAVILFAPTASQTLIIDEPELNLHPAWARVVAGWIARQTSWAQVLIGTHSPEILDPLTEAFQQGDVSLFVFQRAEEGFRVEPCPVERLAGRISEGWMLGDLYRVGDPALGGWPW